MQRRQAIPWLTGCWTGNWRDGSDRGSIACFVMAAVCELSECGLVEARLVDQRAEV